MALSAQRDAEWRTGRDTRFTGSGRRSGLEEEEVSFYVRERYYGAFRRSLTLPAGIDEGDISADYENGMLEIVVRGAATTAGPRRIEIRAKSG